MPPIDTEEDAADDALSAIAVQLTQRGLDVRNIPNACGQGRALLAIDGVDGWLVKTQTGAGIHPILWDVTRIDADRILREAGHPEPGRTSCGILYPDFGCRTGTKP